MTLPVDAPFDEIALVLQPPLDGAVGEAELVAFVPGPAGAAITAAHADVSVEVDYAEPDRLCGILADDVGASRSLELLIGTKSFRAVRSALLQGGDKSRRVTAGSQRARGGRPLEASRTAIRTCASSVSRWRPER